MIYVIYCKDDEIKYQIPESAKLLKNESTEKCLGEIGAWNKIREDAIANNYKTVGIYQARRAFHNNLHILTDTDFSVDNNTIYLSRYVFNNETILQQYKKCHKDFVNLLDEVTPTDYKQQLNANFIYPHNMLYCTIDTFLKLYDFLLFIKNSSAFKKYSNSSSKIFGFLSERLLTMWVNKHNMHVNLCNVVTYDKINGKLLYTINGIDR